MQRQIRRAVFGLSFLFASASWVAAAPRDWTVANDNRFLTFAQRHRLFLSGAQEDIIVQIVRKQRHKKDRAPSGFEPEIGQRVPRSITLHRLPSEVTNRVWAVRPYAYALIGNQLLIVDPQDRFVDYIIAY